MAVRTPLLDAAYQPREWEFYGSSSPLRSGFTAPPAAERGLDVFSIDSERAQQCERRLERGNRLGDDVVIFDIELLETGADVSLHSGGGAYLTPERFEGLPTGTLVLYVYRMADDGHVETLYYVSKPREDDR